jgi:hypothetical protein
MGTGILSQAWGEDVSGQSGTGELSVFAVDSETRFETELIG